LRTVLAFLHGHNLDRHAPIRAGQLGHPTHERARVGLSTNDQVGFSNGAGKKGLGSHSETP
jgi:hypothetical protein